MLTSILDILNSLFDIHSKILHLHSYFHGEVSDAKGTPSEVVERARLESVYTSKGYRGFENIIELYYSYILKSLKDDKYYYGSTEDVDKRLLRHNKGQVPSTKYRRPLIIHFVEEHLNRSLAVQREMFYKSVDGYRFLKENGII